MRLGLVLTMLVMVLAVSIPALADDDNSRFENRLERLQHRLDLFGFDEEDFDCDDGDECNFNDFEDFVDDLDEEDLFGDDLSLEVDDIQFFCGDDDGDGLFDEDEELVRCDNPFALVSFDNDFDGFDSDGDGFDLDID